MGLVERSRLGFGISDFSGWSFDFDLNFGQGAVWPTVTDLMDALLRPLYSFPIHRMKIRGVNSTFLFS